MRDVIGRHFSACNAIDNHSRMSQSDVALEKYWVTQSVYFRLTHPVVVVYCIIGTEIPSNNVKKKQGE